MQSAHQAAKPRARCVRGQCRILYLDHTAVLSGGEIALLNLVRQLNREHFKPIVVLFSEGPLKKKLCAENVETHILPLAPSVVQARRDTLSPRSLFRFKDIALLALFVFRLARFIRSHRVDLIHANSLKADIIGGLAGRLAGVKVIWHVRDRIADDYLPAFVAATFRQLSRLLPHFVVANSNATLACLDQIHPHRTAVVSSGSALPARRQRYRVVHDGMRRDETRTAQASDGSVGRRLTIGMIGRISPWKGQHIFLQAAEIVRRTFPAARFQIVGAALFSEDSFERDVHELARKLGLSDVVEFTGFREDVGDLIAAMDIVVHASTIAEPFGQVVVEAMAAGKPVVATSGGGIPEIVVGGVTGLLVSMGNAEEMAAAICRLIADPVQRREMGRRGCERVMSHFTIERTAANIENIYRGLSHRMARQ